MIAEGPDIMPTETSFVGSYERTVDQQGRIKIPQEVRDSLPADADDTFVVTRWLDGCLAAYPHDQWQAFSESLRQRREISRNLIRLITAFAVISRIDPQGRISIPPKLLEAADIDGAVLLVGTLDKVELWNPNRFEEAVDQAKDDFDDVIGDLSLIDDVDGDMLEPANGSG